MRSRLPSRLRFLAPDRGVFPRAIVVLLASAIPWYFSGNAGADGSLGVDGSYRQGAMREDFTVQQWLAACGPAPTSTTKGGGDSVAVQQTGNELTFTGGGRNFRTDQCYDPLPTLVADVHSREGGGTSGAAVDWRTHCATPDGDPRRASIQTLVALVGTNEIDVSETGRYEITVDQGRCIADVKRSRRFDRLVGATISTAAAPVTASTTPTHATNAEGACANPGPPTSLEVRPSRKLLKPGDSFLFHAEVRDAASCVTGPQPTWSIAGAAPDNGASASGGSSGARANVDATGKVTIPSDASEGVVTLLVTAAGRSAQVEIDVTSPAHLDELLASGSLDAAADDATRVSLVATSGVGTGNEPVRAQDESARHRAIFIAIVGGLAFALAAVALIFHRRTRRALRIEQEALARHAERAREVEERREERRRTHAREVKAHEESLERARRVRLEEAAALRTPIDVPLQCPTCRREFASAEKSGGAFCPFDATRLLPVNENEARGASGSICPSCHRGYASSVKTCPADGDELVPVALHRPNAAPTAEVLEARGKICPSCGGRFDGTAVFCGKDGTALVLLN